MDQHEARATALEYWRANPDMTAAQVAKYMEGHGVGMRPATLRQWKRRHGLRSGKQGRDTSVTGGPEPPVAQTPEPADPPDPHPDAPDAAAVWVDVNSVVPWPDNPRDNEHAVPFVAESIMQFGYGRTFVAWRQADERMLVVGHTARLAVLHNMERHPGTAPPGAPSPDMIPIRWRNDWTQAQARAYAIADNKLGELAGWVDADLARQLEELQQDGIEAQLLGFEDDELARLLGDLQRPPDDDDGPTGVTLAQRFGAPPFSIWDSRQGYWRDRKREWLALGIKSELGRGQLGSTANMSEGKVDYMTGRGNAHDAGSIFDPVLIELGCRWFAPVGGSVLDPFAGGSVRGVVAACLGHQYVGIDLRQDQIDANREQWRDISPRFDSSTLRPQQARPDNMPAVTPVEQIGDIWVKRDDHFSVAGVCGGKVRTCWALAEGSTTGLVTAGSRSSPQVNIVAHVAARLSVPCRVHTPTGDALPEVQAAVQAGAERIEHKPGHNSVIIKRARDDAGARGWTHIPFGMECQEAVRQTAGQVRDLPAGVRRIVVPVGSGMSLAGILWGLQERGIDLPVLGVKVGADPTKRLDRYAPAGWRHQVQLVDTGSDYHDAAPADALPGIMLDPHYEAKCVPYLQAGDLFWIVGMRQSIDTPDNWPNAQPAASSASESIWLLGDSQDLPELLPDDQTFDLVFTCPPYFDLEQYSDDPADLSNMEFDAFVAAYRRILELAVKRLRENRFAMVVIGDVRDRRGFYRGLVRLTAQALEDAGAHVYNLAIYITPAGTLPIRAAKAFRASRKLGNCYQQVVIAFKGDPANMDQLGQIPEWAAPEPEPETEPEPDQHGPA